MSSPSISLMYAELLSNIRQISVIASLPSPATKDTRAKLSSNRQQLELFHNGAITFLTLPVPVTSSSLLQQPVAGSKEISWRLAVAEQTSSNRSVDFSDTAVAPWAANKLSPGTQIACRKCKAVLVTEGRVQSWRDLPSENWAEMMDFWHCHKPSDHQKDGDHQADSHATEKGYGASNRFVAQSGIGFVDLTYFILSEKDCPGIKVFSAPWLTPPQSRSPPLVCTTCNSHLGSLDTLASGFRIHKWSLTVPSLPNPTPPLAQFLTSHLLAQISAQAVHKFIIHAPFPEPTNATSPAYPPKLFVWLFAPRLTISFSHSTPQAPAPVPASKLFYRYIEKDEMDSLLAAADGSLNLSTAVEEVALPDGVMRDLDSILMASTAALPESARKFREWEVGLLERYVGGLDD